MVKKTLKRAPYIQKYGIEKYWIRSRGRKPSPAEVKAVKAEIPGVIKGVPKEVTKQPSGLKEYQKDVRYQMDVNDLSFVEAKKAVYVQDKWIRRRNFHRYPAKVQRYIKATYGKGKRSGKISADRDLMEWVGKS